MSFSLFNVTLCDTLAHSLACCGKHDDDDGCGETVHKECATESIDIIPITREALPIKNLYPFTNCCQNWTIISFGSDRSIIAVQDGCHFLTDVNAKGLQNHKYNDVLKGKCSRFFDRLFIMILHGKHEHFMVLFRGILYVASAFSHKHGEVVIGGVVYIRLLSSIPEMRDGVRRFSVDMSDSIPEVTPDPD